MARRDPKSPLVFQRDGIPVRRWRTAWRAACLATGVPTRLLLAGAAARTLIRASVPERVLTGLKSRTIFDCGNIIHEQELLDAGRGGGIARRGPAVSLAGARRRGGRTALDIPRSRPIRSVKELWIGIGAG